MSDFLWQGICPPKVEVFAWQLLKGRILVREVLLNFGVQQVGSAVCPMCGNGSESINHLFLHCIWSDMVWRICMGWYGVFSCTSPSIREWAICWNMLCPSVS
jgi:hypothetical protein